LITDFITAVWPSAAHERSYAAINLIGLALGFACCRILGLFWASTYSFFRRRLAPFNSFIRSNREASMPLYLARHSGGAYETGSSSCALTTLRAAP